LHTLKGYRTIMKQLRNDLRKDEVVIRQIRTSL